MRDSTSEVLEGLVTNWIYGIKSDGYLTHYYFNKTLPSANRNLTANIQSDGVKYTFGFSPPLVVNGKKSESLSGDILNELNIRQGICQIDKNNFIIMTNTFTSTAQSNRDRGFTYQFMIDNMISYGCLSGYNMDGGGSTSYYYKAKGTSTATKYPTAHTNRLLTDMLYFVEQ